MRAREVPADLSNARAYLQDTVLEVHVDVLRAHAGKLDFRPKLIGRL
jgi:hypothetical protein